MKKIIATLLTVLFLILFPVTILLYRAQNLLLQPDTILSVLWQKKVYEQITPLVLNELKIDRFLAEANVAGLITVEQLNAAATNIFPANWIQNNVTQVVSEIFKLSKANMTLNDVRPSISMSAPKSAAQAELQKIIEQLTVKFNNYAPCTNAQLLNLTNLDENNILGMLGQLNQLQCWPSSQIGTPENFFNQIQPDSHINDIFNEVPDEILLLELIDKTSRSSMEMQIRQIQKGVQIMRWALLAATVILFIIVAVIMALFWKKQHTLFNWLTVLFLSAGIITVAIGSAFFINVQYLITNFGPPLEISTAAQALLFTIASGVARQFFQPILVVGVIMIIMAAVFIIATRFVGKKQLVKQKHA